jgi:hypothetical protein
LPSDLDPGGSSDHAIGGGDRRVAVRAYLESVCGAGVADRLTDAALEALGPDAADWPEIRAAARDVALGRLRETRRLHRGCRRAADLLAKRRDGTISAADLGWLYGHLDHCRVCSGFAARVDAADWVLEAASPGRPEIFPPPVWGDEAEAHELPPASDEVGEDPYEPHEPDDASVPEDQADAGAAWPGEPAWPDPETAADIAGQAPLDPAAPWPDPEPQPPAPEPAPEAFSPEPPLGPAGDADDHAPASEPSHDSDADQPPPTADPGSTDEESDAGAGEKPRRSSGAAARDATEPVAPVLEGRRRRRRPTRRTAALLVVVVAGGAAAAGIVLLGGRGSQKPGVTAHAPAPSRTTPAATAPAVPASALQTRPTRAAFEVDGARWAVFSDPMRPWVTRARRLPPVPGRVWRFVEVLVRNLRRAPFAPCALHYRLEDAAGRTYFPDPRAGTAAPAQQPPVTLAGGGLTSCRLGFVVPMRGAGLRLAFDPLKTPGRYEIPL